MSDFVILRSPAGAHWACPADAVDHWLRKGWVHSDAAPETSPPPPSADERTSRPRTVRTKE